VDRAGYREGVKEGEYGGNMRHVETIPRRGDKEEQWRG
jgi:hypothetical protein